MYYRHNLNYTYPDRSDQHMIDPPKKVSVSLDENYPFLDKSRWYKFKRFWMHPTFYCLVFPVNAIRYGIRIFGRKNLKKNKKLLKEKGAITICNHVYKWDFIAVMQAIRPKTLYFPVWKNNVEGPERGLIRWVGGIPVPTDNFKGTRKFKQALDEVLDDKNKWLHFFPEASMWWYYPDIRPFKITVFKLAYDHDRPIIPIGISFRPRKGFFKLFGKSPCVDVHVGDILIPDKTLPRKDAVDKLHHDAYVNIQSLVGVNKGDPTYNENQNIDDYKKTM